MSKLPLVSLFCGPGGLDEGFRTQFVTRLAYDIEKSCVLTHRRNHPQAHAIQTDLSKINVSEIIFEWNKRSGEPPVGLLGGPPCQSFSRSNVYKQDNDPRDTLPRHYARILKALHEAYGLHFFVFENVPGLLDDDHLPVFEEFKRMAEDAGFMVSEGMLDALDFGVPQVRERIFIVGLNEDIYTERFDFSRLDTREGRSVRQAISHLPEPVHFNRSLTPEDIKKGAGHVNHWCMRPKSKKFTDGTLKPGEIKGRCFRVLAWDKPSYTVAYGHREVHVHPNCTRRLSIYEAMLLQGFPEDYEFVGTLSAQIDMVSDAVAPPVARALAKAIDLQLNVPQHDKQLKLALASTA